MGHMSRFNFPIPGRKSKPVPPPSPLTAPRTKADKILGTGDVLDAIPLESPRYAWETRSLSAISISVSDTSASHAGTGTPSVGGTDGMAVRPSTMGKKDRWEEESEVLPRSFQERPQHVPARIAHETTITDASSLRRRQSSSTITSYYDKAKLPLSISQQTSNSAMAKGLPTKAQALLDMEGAYIDTAGKSKKNKPNKLDLSSLIPGRARSRFLSPRTLKGLVLGPDAGAKSPSVLSVSTGDATPPPIAQRNERNLRPKPTKESLRDVPPVPQLPPHMRASPTQEGSRHRHTKSTVDLMNLYDHYEQRTFADADEDELEPQPVPPASYPTPPTSSSGNGYLAPTAPNPIRIVVASKEAPMTTNPHDLLMGMSPSSLVTPPPDNASVSSRHTRTSKASKQTNQSSTDLDLQLNSMLSLSSDSEDDDYAVSSKSSLAVPTLSDSQPSPTSSHSVTSQTSTAPMPHDASRTTKAPKRTSFAVQPQFHTIPEGTAPASLPRIAPRTSSLSLRMAVQKSRSSLFHNASISSITTTSSGKTVPATSTGISEPSAAPKASPPRQANWSAPALDRFNEFPSPPSHHAAQPSQSSSNREPTPPLSPSSMEFYLQERLSRTTFDNQSIRSGRSRSSSMKDAQGAGTPSRHQHNDSVGSASGRFMAVTRQEEMLLAALRQKRARMREDIMAELEDNDRDGDDEGTHQLQRQMTNSSSGVSRQSSRSTTRTFDASGLGAPSARLQRVANQRFPGIDERGGRGQILLMMDRSAMGQPGSGIETAEPSPDLDGFLGFDEMMAFPAVPTAARSASRQRSSSKAGSTRGRVRDGSLSGMTRAKFGGEDSSSSGGDKDVIQEDPRESLEEEAGIPRPDSPIAPEDFPIPAAMASRKQVRLSAVGNYQPPNIEQGWWDDSG